MRAINFANDYQWKFLADPVDSSSGQIDTVSSDGASGSIFPLLASTIAADQDVPVAFIPTAKGGTSALAWQPGVDHFNTSTLYGQMANRISAAGGAVKAVLWFQGETDASGCTA